MSREIESHSSNSGRNGHDVLADPQARALAEQLLATLSNGQMNGHAPELRPNEPEKPNTLNLYLAALRRRWLPMLAVFLLAFALIVWHIRPIKKEFTATSVMLLPKPKSAGGELGQKAELMRSFGLPSDAGSGTLSVDTQMAIVASPGVVQRALDQIGPELVERGWDNPKDWDGKAGHLTRDLAEEMGQKNMISATAPVSSDLVNISVTSHDEAASIALANTLIKVFATRTQELADESNQSNLNEVAQQIRDAQGQLGKAKDELQHYKEQTGVGDIKLQSEAISNFIQKLEEQNQKARLDMNAGTSGSEVQSDATATALRQKAAEARLNYEKVLRDFLPSSPEATQARQESDAAQNLLDARVASLVEAQRKGAQDTQAALDQARTRAQALPGIENKLSDLLGRVGVLEANYRALIERYTSLRLSRYQAADTATALNSADKALPSGRTWLRTILTAFFAAFSLSALIGALLEHLDSSVHSPDDLKPSLSNVLLGTMPYLGGRVERRLALASGAQTLELLEACRVARANLLLSSVEPPLRSVLITSADGGEGKSLTAFNLATVIAYDARRVILLDCDLRRPTQHELLEVALAPGFADVATGAASIEAALRPTKVPGLSLLTAGTPLPNQPELLNSEAGRALIADLRERCDLLLIDSPPVLSLADAQVLSSLADGVVLVVAADETPRAHIEHAQTMLRHVGGRLIGVILNKVKAGNDPYSSSYYYSKEPQDDAKALPMGRTGR